jgi:hypothetical protein
MTGRCLLESSSFVWAKNTRLLVSEDRQKHKQDLRLGSPARLYIYDIATDPLECMVHHSSLRISAEHFIEPGSLP